MLSLSFIYIGNETTTKQLKHLNNAYSSDLGHVSALVCTDVNQRLLQRFQTGLSISYHPAPLPRQWSTLSVSNNSTSLLPSHSHTWNVFALQVHTVPVPSLYCHTKHASIILLTRRAPPITPVPGFLTHFPRNCSAWLAHPVCLWWMFYDINNYIFPGAFNQKSRNRKKYQTGTAWACMVAAANIFTRFKGLIEFLLHFGGLTIRTGW